MESKQDTTEANDGALNNNKAATQIGGNAATAFSTDLLRIYYARLFPYDEMFRWLSYGNDPHGEGVSQTEKDFFHRREFSFTIENDIYIRYLAFRDGEEMAAAMQKRQPHKIDIGAVFTHPPKDHHTVNPGSFKPVERELVFDIDMTDYDDVRTCCSGASVCQRCWHFMSMAIKVMDRGLKQDFGFEHIMWVFSGRRGVHCWVSDVEARSLSNDARSAVVEYFNVVEGGDNQAQKCRLTSPLHPTLQSAYEILEPMFRDHVVPEEGQGILATAAEWDKVLAMIPDEGVRSALSDEWTKKQSSPKKKWAQLKATVEKAVGRRSKKQRQSSGGGNGNEGGGLNVCVREIVFTYCYPRLDINVSKAQNHLLKSPFAVHPKTGRVCVPFAAEDCEAFNPLTVPTLGTLCEQIDRYDGQDGGTVSDLQKTELHGHVQFFANSFLRPLLDSVRREKRAAAERDAAANGDF